MGERKDMGHLSYIRTPHRRVGCHPSRAGNHHPPPVSPARIFSRAPTHRAPHRAQKGRAPKKDPAVASLAGAEPDEDERLEVVPVPVVAEEQIVGVEGKALIVGLSLLDHLIAILELLDGNVVTLIVACGSANIA